MQQAGYFVNRIHVWHGNHAPLRHVGEQRNFFALFLWNGAVGAAQQRIRLYTNFTQLLHGVLRGFGFEFTGRWNPRQVGQVHKGGHIGAHAQAELAHRLQKGQRLNVANGATYFNNGNIDGVFRAHTRAALHKILYFVGHVGNNLHSLAQIVTAAFFFEHAFVDLTSGEVVGLLHARFYVTLVVAQIEVGFGTIVGDIHLAVLEG